MGRLGGEIIQQNNLNPEALFDKIKKMTDDINKYQITTEIDINIFRNASKKIVKVLKDLVNEKANQKKNK